MATFAGDAAADIVGRLARSSARPPDLSTAGEEEARSLFQSDAGSFMVNWPYVYGTAKEGVGTGAIDQSVFDDIASLGLPQLAQWDTISLGMTASSAGEGQPRSFRPPKRPWKGRAAPG